MGIFRKSLGLVVILSLFFIPALQASSNDMPRFNGHKKMGLSLTREWRSAMESGDIGQEVSVAVKTKREIGERDRRSMRRAGLKTRSFRKTTTSGKIKIADLPYLVGLDFVRSVELAGSLGLK